MMNFIPFSFFFSSSFLWWVFWSKKNSLQGTWKCLYWPFIFKDTYYFCKSYEKCHRTSNITYKNQMPLTNILVSEFFNVWGINFIDPFSFDNFYILIVVDYISKWIEAKALWINIVTVVLDLAKTHIFDRFGILEAIISDCDTHICNRSIEALLCKYNMTHPKLKFQIKKPSLFWKRQCNLISEIRVVTWWCTLGLYDCL